MRLAVVGNLRLDPPQEIHKMGKVKPVMQWISGGFQTEASPALARSARFLC